MPTKIEWCDETWNFLTGCSPLSEGCQHCYAKRMAKRLAGRYGYPKDDPFRVTFHPDRMEEPWKWAKPRIVFPCSMSDLFHHDVDGIDLAQVRRDAWHIMESCPRDTFLVLTKRDTIMRSFCMTREPMKHIWLGVTVENQKHDDRIITLLNTPAGKRFVSIEPMLGPVDLTRIKIEWLAIPQGAVRPIGRVIEVNALTGNTIDHMGIERTGGPKLDLVICGGETGPGARECNLAWPRLLRDQCVKAGVPFFFKKWGDWNARHYGRHFAKQLIGSCIDGQQWRQWPVSGVESAAPRRSA